MKDGQRTLNRVAAPIRNLAQRFAYAGLIIAAFGLMMLGKVETAVIERVRAQVTDAVAPILDVVARPIEAVNAGVAEVEALINVYEENKRLKEERARLFAWQEVAHRLDTENKVLREFLNVVPEKDVRFITGRVIGDTGGAFAHSVIVNAGERDGVRKGQAAVTAEGLVGRVTDVGGRSSRIILITDLNARIPVYIEQSRTRSIMAGNNKIQPKLTRLPTGAVINVGDRVVTSGHAGVFPPGLPVGQVSANGETGILIQPFVDLSRVQYVRILDFGFGGILGTEDEAATADAGRANVGEANVGQAEAGR